MDIPSPIVQEPLTVGTFIHGDSGPLDMANKEGAIEVATFVKSIAIPIAPFFTDFPYLAIPYQRDPDNGQGILFYTFIFPLFVTLGR